MAFKKPVVRQRLTGSTKARHERALEALRQDYLTGRKVDRYESPKMIAKYGRGATLPPAEAAERRTSFLDMEMGTKIGRAHARAKDKRAARSPFDLIGRFKTTKVGTHGKKKKR